MEDMNYIDAMLNCFDMKMSALLSIEEAVQTIEKFDQVIEELDEDNPEVDMILDAQIELEQAIEKFHDIIRYLTDEINVGLDLRNW